MPTHDDLNLLLAGLVFGVAVVGLIAVGIARWDARRCRECTSQTNRLNPAFYGDQITTDPDAGTVTREGRRNG